MIKLPINVNKTMRKLTVAGFEVFCVGGCVRDSLIGERPLDWDLATNARLGDMTALFPEAEVLSEKYSVIRLDFTSESDDEVIIDIATYRTEGKYSDRRRPDEVSFVDGIEEDLKRRDFTVNAIAENPSTRRVDPYDGMADIKNKLIRSVGNAAERFDEDPLRILRAVRLCAELDFDMSMEDYRAAESGIALLEHVSIDRRRAEFERIVNAKAAGKGLRMLAGIGAMPYIVGDVAQSMRRREADDFTILCENIDKTMQLRERRLGLFYLCFDRGKALKAIEFLNYDAETREHLEDSAKLMPKLYFIKTEQELKDFLLKYGRNRYDYLHNLAKAQRIVYDYSEVKIMNRIYMMDQIRMRNDPIFIEDLAIDGNDIVGAGIAEGEKVGELLYMLAEYVHKKPAENTRESLLPLAKRYAKNPVAAKLRKVNWQR